MSDAQVQIFTNIGAGLDGLPRFDRHSKARIVQQVLADHDDIRQDAGLTAAFARQLEYIFKEIYEIEFPDLKATQLIPLTTEVTPGALTFTYRMWNEIGKAQVIHNYGADAPNADIDAEEFPAPVITVGSSYNFSVVDIQRAAMTNTPIESLKARSARRAIERLLESIAAIGSANEGVVGLTNAPGILGVSQVSTGGNWLTQIANIGAATAAAPASAVAATQGIVTDINAMINTTYTKTLTVHRANTLVLPPELYVALDTCPRSPAFTTDSVLDYIKKVCKVDITDWVPLQNAGALGTVYKSRVMCYKKDPDVLRLVQAQPFTQLPPQPKNFAWQVPCMAQAGGCMVIRPLAVAYMDGLSG